MKTNTPGVPQITPELIKWLDRMFPFPLPDPSTPERILWKKVGERTVYEALLKLYENQSKKDLQG